MARKSDDFKLSEKDRNFLKSFTKKGIARAQEVKRGLALLLLDERISVKEINEKLSYGHGTVYRIRNKYNEKGLDLALYDKPRSGRPPEILGADKAKITALACSDAPDGHVRWTLRMLADKAIELDYVTKGDISHTWINKILKKTNSDRI